MDRAVAGSTAVRTQLAPESTEYSTAYPVTGDPPSETDGLQYTESVLYPAFTYPMRGADGTVGDDGVTVAVPGSDVPNSFSARTLTVWSIPPVRPVMTSDRTAASTRLGDDHTVPSVE